MKKLACLLIAFVMCLGIAVPAYAAEDAFVPSISYKGSPEVTEARMDDRDVSDCVIVTSIVEAENMSTDISQEDRDLLLDVYEQLKNGDMSLPIDEEYVIRELVDVSFEYDDCRNIEEHGHKDVQLKQEGTTLTLTFDLNAAAVEEILVYVYIDGQWQTIESVKNNGDGTVTCVFENICPVAFAVKDRTGTMPPQTGDTSGQNLMLWICVLAASVAVLLAIVFVHRRKCK